MGSLSWVSICDPGVLGISLVTRGQFSTRSAWTWAGTQRGIYSSVVGIISKELPKETTNIFTLPLTIDTIIFYHLRGMMNISKPFVTDWRSHTKKLSLKVLKLTILEEKPSFRGNTEKKRGYDLGNTFSPRFSEEQCAIIVHFWGSDNTSLNLNFILRMITTKWNLFLKCCLSGMYHSVEWWSNIYKGFHRHVVNSVQELLLYWILKSLSFLSSQMVWLLRVCVHALAQSFLRLRSPTQCSVLASQCSKLRKLFVP